MHCILSILWHHKCEHTDTWMSVNYISKLVHKSTKHTHYSHIAYLLIKCNVDQMLGWILCSYLPFGLLTEENKQWTIGNLRCVHAQAAADLDDLQTACRVNPRLLRTSLSFGNSTGMRMLCTPDTCCNHLPTFLRVVDCSCTSNYRV